MPNNVLALSLYLCVFLFLFSLRHFLHSQCTRGDCIPNNQSVLFSTSFTYTHTHTPNLRSQHRFCQLTPQTKDTHTHIFYITMHLFVTVYYLSIKSNVCTFFVCCCCYCLCSTFGIAFQNVRVPMLFPLQPENVLCEVGFVTLCEHIVTLKIVV